MKITQAAKSGIFLLFGFAITLSAAAQNEVFHATFDRDFRANYRNGIITGKQTFELTMETLSMLLQDGIKGKAARIGAEEINGENHCSSVQYPGTILSPETGTIAFWLKPLNWDFNDAKFHIFCEAKGPKSWLVIYKYNNAREVYFLFGTPGKGGKGVSYVIAAARASKWKKNTFHHITAVWNKKDIRLYIDGEMQSMEKIPASIAPGAFKTLTIGPNPFWKDQPGHFLIDDFKIYKQALSGSDVEKLFTDYGVKKIDKSKIPVKISKLNLISTPDGNLLNLNFFLSRTDSAGKGFPVEMEIFKGGKSVIKKRLTSSSTEYHHSFDLKKLQNGEYLLLLRPVRETAEDKIENKTFLFTIGHAEEATDHSVPAPWTPVRFENGILSAKMQKVDISKGLLPSQLYSENIPLLRSPMRFIYDGKNISGKAAVKITEKYPDFQTVENRIRNKDFSLTSRCRFEFDGMMWFEVTLTPKKTLQVKNAKIEIPFHSESSTLYNQFVKEYFSFSGFHAGELNKTVKCNHYLQKSFPGIWVGNEERGLYYFTQDQAGRRLKKRSETIRLDPGKAGALLTINLIDYPSEISDSVTWTFGLQITPVRPFVRDRAYWRPEHRISLWFAWEKIHNVPDARFRKSNYDNLRKQLSGNGKRPVFHYFAGFSASPETPGYPVNAHEWSITPPAIGTEVAPNSDEWKYIFVCANSKNYRATYLRNLGKCIRDLRMENLYFDNCWSFYCGNRKHGCGWYDENGKFYPTFNVLGSRELAKGCYRTLQKIYPGGKIARHISQTPEPPLIAFADCLADGECFMMNVGKDESYYNLFTSDSFRASFMGSPLGIPSVFIAQFNRAYQLHFPEKWQAAKAGTLKNQELHLRHFSGYALVHDTGVWPNFGVNIKKFLDIMDRAGVKSNSAFYGYWNKNNPVKKIASSDKRIMVSCYICKNGAIAVLMNDTDAPATVKLALDQTIFGTSPAVTDAENNKKVNPQSVLLPKRDFRLLKISSNK